MTEIYIHLERGEVYTNWIAIHDMWPDKRKQSLGSCMFWNYYNEPKLKDVQQQMQFSSFYLN